MIFRAKLNFGYLFIVFFISQPMFGQGDDFAKPDLEIEKTFRVITHLHTSFSHDARFWSEPHLQLDNLKKQGYQAVLVSDHDHSTFSSTQTNFTVAPFKNGRFETGKEIPAGMRLINHPVNSDQYQSASDSAIFSEGQKSFHLTLKGDTDKYDLLSWAYWEKGADQLRDRAIAYDLWLTFSVYFSELPATLDSTAYICAGLGRRADVRYKDVSKKICFYFSDEPWDVFPLSENPNTLLVRMEPPKSKNWKQYEFNLSDLALDNFQNLEGVPIKYLFLKQVTLNLLSKDGATVDFHIDDLRVFSKWTSHEMYRWWKNDIESYSDENFLVIAGIEATHDQDIAAYGLENWHNFLKYDLVEDRVDYINRFGALSIITSPRAHKFAKVKAGHGWGANLIEIFNTVHDSKPSLQVLKGWDAFLSRRVRIGGVTGFDSHGLKKIPGQRNPTVVVEPIYENIVFAESLTKQSVFDALRNGHFFVRKSQHPIFMTFSPGSEVIHQMGGTLRTTKDKEKAVNVRIEGVPVPSKLVVYADGSKLPEIKIKKDPFYRLIQIPSNKGSYVRYEIHHLGNRIAFSNPIYFEDDSAPKRN